MARGTPKSNASNSRHGRERHRYHKRQNAAATTSVPALVPLPQSQGSILPSQYPAPPPQPPPAPSQPPERTSAPLEGLPGKVWDQISSYTPYETLFAVQRSSPILWKKVDPTLAPEETKVSFVLRAESEFPQHQQRSSAGRRSGRSGGSGSGRNRNNGGGGHDDDDNDDRGRGQGQDEERTNNYGCFKCYRVLPPTQFEAPYLPNNSRVPGRPRVPVNMRRFCIPCGVDAGIYQPKEQIVPMKGPKVWLCDCECGVIHDEGTYHCRVCRTHCPFRL